MSRNSEYLSPEENLVNIFEVLTFEQPVGVSLARPKLDYLRCEKKIFNEL